MTNPLEEKDALEAIYNGLPASKLQFSDEVRKTYDLVMEELDLDMLPDQVEFTRNYFYPKEYDFTLDEIVSRLEVKCKNDDEIKRLVDELYIFDQINQLDVIKYFIYLVDYMNERRIVWGVGRGSSVSVFVFYLIGLHKVNSVKYGLDFTDFFKIKE